MTLAAILVFYFLSLSGSSLGNRSLGHPGLNSPSLSGQNFETQSPAQPQDQNSAATPPSQTPPAQSPKPEPVSAAPASPPQNSPSPAKPSPKHQGYHKKPGTPDCSNAPSTLNPAGGSPSTGANSTGTTSAGSGDPPPTQPGAATNPAKPCPPPIVVIKNGGSDEPTVELKGNSTAEQASQQRFTTEQLTTATEENLKKIAGRQLNPSERETLSQIKQFMEQTKSAIAAGDLTRAHNLAMKAHLLSDEFVKP